MGTLLTVFGKAATAFFLKMVMSLATEQFIKWLFFYVGEQIVKSTKTNQDDLFLAKIKEVYDEYDHSSVSTK
jgi:hypothetical protein